MPFVRHEVVERIAVRALVETIKAAQNAALTQLPYDL